jgi:carbamoyl-phosphate synthase small subunit
MTTNPSDSAAASVQGRVVTLTLEDGNTFTGRSFGAERSVAGEVIFNTGMVGYPETLTDPSYSGQIITFTYPMIGNYGVSPSDKYDQAFFESEKVQVQAMLVSDYSDDYHHWFAGRSLADWLKQHDVPGVTGIDTRTLTKILREKGTMLGKLEFENEPVELWDPRKENMVKRVAPQAVEKHGSGSKRVVLLDCGCKKNILQSLLSRGVEVLRVPYDHDLSQEEFDGLLLSNGPGDPKEVEEAIKVVRQALELNKPTFGICLGHQLMAHAVGANTFRLKYGHRSQNQPVLEVGTDRGFVTSQNHGYAVDPDSLPDDWEPWFTNLNDGTNEGIRHKTGPFRSVQFHPEAAPGPVDAGYLFDEFVEQL